MGLSRTGVRSSTSLRCSATGSSFRRALVSVGPGTSPSRQRAPSASARVGDSTRHGGTDFGRGSAVAPDLVDVEGSCFPDLVHADAARVAPVRTVLVHVTQQLMFIRAPFAVVGAEDDDVVDPSLPQEMRVLSDVGTVVPGDALREKHRIE